MKPCSSIRLLEFWDKTTRKKWRSEEEEEEGIAGHLFLGDKKIFFNLLRFLLDLQLIEPVGLWVNILEGGLPNRHWVVLLGFLHDSPLNGVSVDLSSVELASCFQSCFQNQQPYTRTSSYAAALQAYSRALVPSHKKKKNSKRKKSLAWNCWSAHCFEISSVLASLWQVDPLGWCLQELFAAGISPGVVTISTSTRALFSQIQSFLIRL